MLSILALSVVGSWTYAGFLAEPTPAPTPATGTMIPPASAPIESGPVEGPETGPEKGPASPAQAPPRPQERPEVPTPPKPTLYRSTDALGQTWEHPDSNYLASFVEARNRSFAAYTYASPPPARSSRCVTGRCN